MSVETELNVVKLISKHHLPKSSICTSFSWQRCTLRLWDKQGQRALCISGSAFWLPLLHLPVLCEFRLVSNIILHRTIKLAT